MAVPTWYNIGVSEQFSIAYKSLIEIVLWENFLWQFRLVWNTINNFTQNKLISILLSFPVNVLRLFKQVWRFERVKIVTKLWKFTWSSRQKPTAPQQYIIQHFCLSCRSWVLGFELHRVLGPMTPLSCLFWCLAKVNCSGQGSAAPRDQLEKDRRREKQHHRDGHWRKYFQMSLSFKHIYKQGSIRLLFQEHFKFLCKGEDFLAKYINLGDKNLVDDF